MIINDGDLILLSPNFNALFAVMSLLSIIIEFPQILSNCVPGQPQTDIARLS